MINDIQYISQTDTRSTVYTNISNILLSLLVRKKNVKIKFNPSAANSSSYDDDEYDGDEYEY